MSDVLHSKIATVRARHGVVEAGRGIAMVVTCAVALLAASMLLDWWLEFPLWLRGAVLAVELTALAYVLMRYAVWPVAYGPDDDEFALMVERAEPSLATRLIASIQLSREDGLAAGASVSIVRAMVAQTEALAGAMNFGRVVKADRLIKPLLVAMAVLLAGAGAGVWAGQTGSDLLKRAFLASVPVPRNTRVIADEIDRPVPTGEAVVLRATAQGVIPPTGTVRIVSESGRKLTFDMDPAKDAPARFSRTIDNVQESFTFVVRLNDGHSQEQSVRVVPRPAVTMVQCVQTFPAYTGRGRQARQGGDLSLLAGSTLEIKARSSKPLRSAVLHLAGLDKDQAMNVGGVGADEATATIEIPRDKLSGFSIKLMDRDGISSRGETIYPIDVVKDKEPTLVMRKPERKDELITLQGQIEVAFEATDDFGVASAFFHYQIEGASEQKVELDLALKGVEDPRRIARRFLKPMASLTPPPGEGSVVEFWVEVRDGNNKTGPGVVLSEHYKAKVVSNLEKTTELMGRSGELLGSIDYLQQDQEKLNAKLGALILEKK